jgi:hypothetical protein
MIGSGSQMTAGKRYDIHAYAQQFSSLRPVTFGEFSGTARLDRGFPKK